jgi:hypothetical protein
MNSVYRMVKVFYKKSNSRMKELLLLDPIIDCVCRILKMFQLI